MTSPARHHRSPAPPPPQRRTPSSRGSRARLWRTLAVLGWVGLTLAAAGVTYTILVFLGY